MVTSIPSKYSPTWRTMSETQQNSYIHNSISKNGPSLLLRISINVSVAFPPSITSEEVSHSTGYKIQISGNIEGGFSHMHSLSATVWLPVLILMIKWGYPSVASCLSKLHVLASCGFMRWSSPYTCPLCPGAWNGCMPFLTPTLPISKVGQVLGALSVFSNVGCSVQCSVQLVGGIVYFFN